MKKQLLSLLFLLTLCVPIIRAEETSFTISFKSGTGTSDGAQISDSNYLTNISDGTEYINNLTNLSTVYLGKSGYGWKFGSSKNNGTVNINLKEALLPTKIVINAADYKSDSPTVTINNMSCKPSGMQLADYTLTGYTDKTSSINISTSKRAYIKSITIYYEIEGGDENPKEENGLGWSAETYDYTMGEVLEAPTLVNPNNLTVAYSSSDETVATIDATGALEIQGAGTTTITAKFDGDDTYKEGSVSYELTVTKPIDPNAPLSDEITAAGLGVSNAKTYEDFNNKSCGSDAKYSGQAMLNSSVNIQLNTGKTNGTNNYRGIYTVESAGLLKSVSIVFASNNSNTVKLLASNSPFNPTTDYSKQTAIAELNKTTSKYIFEEDYNYFAIISKSGAIYITSIDVEWAEDVPQVATPTYEFINYLNFEYADIKLACETEGVTYKYTINGGEEQSTDGIIRLNEFGTYEVTFWAEKDGMRASKKTTETIVYKSPFEMSFNLEPGEYPYGTEVTVSIESENVLKTSATTFGYEITYADSSISKDNVEFENLKFTLTENCTITVKLTYDSDVYVYKELIGSFTVSAPEAPKFSKDGGLVLAGTEVTLTAAEGMTIYYTTDGTEPTNESTLYAAPIVVNDDMTIRAVAYIGALASKVAEASFDVQNSLAEINALAGGDTVLYSGELTVVYASGAYNYVYDGTNYSLLYKDLGLQANDVIKAGWSGAVSYYNGLYEIKDVKSIETVADATPLKAVPVEVRRNDFDQIVTHDNMHAYVEIKNIEITNLDTKKNFTSAFGTIYNQLGCSNYTEAGHYDIVGFVGYYESGTTKTVQIFPASMTLLEDPMIKVYWHNHNGTTSINWNAPHVHYSLDGETFEKPVKMLPSQTAMAIKAYATETTAPNDWEAEIPAKSTHVFFTNNGDESKKTQANEAVDGKHYTPTNDDVTGIENITVENAAVEYFNLQGVRVANPSEGGIYIMRQGSKTSKIRF